MIDFTGKTAIVTGSGRGIGRAIATKLSAAGASVMINDLDPAPCEEASAAIANSAAFPGDMTAPEFPQKLVDQTLERFGSIDTIRRLIDIHPADGWARRELSAVLSATGRLDEALAQADVSIGLDPANPSAPFYRGLVLARLGRIDDARQMYRAAISLSVDAEYAIAQLMMACDSTAQKIEALAFVRGELVRQTILGEALGAYRNQAKDVLSANDLLASLREALVARPDLWQAWSAVVNQLSEMGRGDEALEIALQATERFSLLPRVWLDLASVHRSRGDNAAQTAALLKTLELSPGWGQPVRALAEVYERAGEFERSRHLLEQSIRRSPLDPYTHGCLADVHWKLNDRESAIARVQHAVKLDPGYRWAWDMLSAWSAECGKPEVAVESARDLTVRRAGEARSWLVLARALKGDETLEERLAAAEMAASLSPRAIDAYDLRARLLAQAKRYDEALAACAPASFGSHIPASLRARAAWVDNLRGNHSAAIDAMRGVVAEVPGYYWAWTCLADWYRRDQNHVEYLNTANNLVRLFPLDAVSQGYLGEALLRNGHRDLARSTLRKVVERHPDYDYGATTLFDMALEDGDLDSAAQTLGILRVQSPGIWTTLRQGKLAARQRDEDTAAACLKKLCEPNADAKDAIGMLAESMDQSGMAKRAEQVMRDALAVDSAPVGISNRIVELMARKKRWKDACAFTVSVASRGTIGVDAACTLFHHLGDAKVRPHIRRAVKSTKQLVRSQTRVWGQVGFALKSVRDYRGVIKWTSDWKERADAEPWMLVNIAASLRALGRDARAREVHRHAIDRLSRGGDCGSHLIWLAVDAARAGDVTVAEDLLKRPETHFTNRPYSEFIRLMSELVLAARKRSGFKDLRAILKKALETNRGYIHERELRRLYRKCMWTLVRTGPGVRVRVWALEHLMERTH